MRGVPFGGGGGVCMGGVHLREVPTYWSCLALLGGTHFCELFTVRRCPFMGASNLWGGVPTCRGEQNLWEVPTCRGSNTFGCCLLIGGAHLMGRCFFTHQVYQLSCVIAQDHTGRTSRNSLIILHRTCSP